MSSDWSQLALNRRMVLWVIRVWRADTEACPLLTHPADKDVLMGLQVKPTVHRSEQTLVWA